MSKAPSIKQINQIFKEKKAEEIRKVGLPVIELKLLVRFEMHADGVKEVLDECPFCEIPCNEPHCPYTKEE